MQEMTVIHQGKSDLMGSIIVGNVRATIKRNSHDFQSWGKVEAWTASGWTEIQRFPIDRFRVFNHSYVGTNGWEIDMKEDLGDLANLGWEFLVNMKEEQA